MSKFHTLKVANVRGETADCVSVLFEVPPSLKNEFTFIQGQYVTLKLMVHGEEIRRSYSICNAPFENELRVAVKRVKNGRVSNYINDNFRQGMEVEVMIPLGGFHSPMHVEHKKKYVLFAGGSGITPMLSIIKTVLNEEPQSSLTLFYGNLNEENTIFKNELEKLCAESNSRLRIFYMLDKPLVKMEELYTGIMNKEKVKKLIEKHVPNDNNQEFFICGPVPMMDNVRETLEEKKIDKSKIHIEYFATADSASAEQNNTTDKLTSQVTVSLYAMETTFSLVSTGKSILDAALDAGVDAPFSCKGGVCATCKGKLLEGKVRMDKNFALTDSEVEGGYILTCQSHPTTPVVKVDYDI